MYMLSEGGRYDSWIALLFLNPGRGSLHPPYISRACSYPSQPFCYHIFQASGEDRVWGQELLIFWVCAELLGYREKWTFKEKGWWKEEDLLSCLEIQKGPLVRWKRSFGGWRVCMHMGWNVVVPAALTQVESQASSSQKNGRGGSKRHDPLAPSLSLLARCAQLASYYLCQGAVGHQAGVCPLIHPLPPLCRVHWAPIWGSSEEGSSPKTYSLLTGWTSSPFSTAATCYHSISFNFSVTAGEGSLWLVSPCPSPLHS